MGNGCSVFKINKICLNGELKMENLEEQNKNDENNNNNILLNENSQNISVKKQITKNSNGIKIKSNQIQKRIEPHFSLASLPVKVIQNIENSKVENNENNENKENNESSEKNENNENNEDNENNLNQMSSNKLNNFTNFVQDLDISFKGSKPAEQSELFNTNYISLDSNYNQEIFNYINKIRKEPNNIIYDIDDLLNKRQIINNKVQIESEETHENVVLDDGGNALEETKEYLNNVIPILANFNLNEDLLIEIPEVEKNELSLDKKITKILMDKRKSIIEKYPNCQFFINFIKDKKLGLLYLLSQNENMSNFRNIIFNENYKEFNITWIKEKKKIFIAFLCFA